MIILSLPHTIIFEPFSCRPYHLPQTCQFSVVAICIGIAQPAVLTKYARRFEERVARYDRAWHLCLKAEERCRSEFWGNERRRQARFAEADPTLSSVEKDMPWNSVIKEAADNLE